MKPGTSAEQTDESLISGEELYDLGDKERAELIEGKIRTMPPTGFMHGDVELTIGSLLRDFVTQNQLGRVMTGEVGIYTRRNPDTVRGADILYISHNRLQQVKSDSYLDVAPELIVEVLSPNDLWVEVNTKLEEYFSIGVDLVWIADPDKRRLHVYTSIAGISILNEEDSVRGGSVLPGFECQVKELFS